MRWGIFVGTITFVLRDGRTRTVTALKGTVMEAARAAGVAGIVGECGGACACGTCHVHLPPEALALLGPATPAEENILEFEDLAGPSSRLCCQIQVADIPDGLVLAIPGDDR